MSEPDTLFVFFDRRRAGSVFVRGDRFGFTYDTGWLAAKDSFAISRCLPLREPAHEDEAAHSFFANLLPEGDLRVAVCRRLGISIDNDYALLARIGGECAGALSIRAESDLPEDEEPEYVELTKRRLDTLLRGESVVPLLAGGATTRLSLAGAQDKLPVFLHDDRLHIPVHAEPTTHILKLPSRRFSHLCANEAFMNRAAAALGLEVARTVLVTDRSIPYLLVERYDREVQADGFLVKRLHQEDLCQALGYPATRKYEEEGGPSFGRCYTTVAAAVDAPLPATLQLLSWAAFNVIAGNSDGHAKNLALLHPEPGRTVLAPFYDLVSTRAYKELDRHLAMRIGGERDPDLIGRAHVEALARALEIGPAVVEKRAIDIAERCLDRIDTVAADFLVEHGPQPILQTLPRAMKKRARALLRRIRAT